MSSKDRRVQVFTSYHDIKLLFKFIPSSNFSKSYVDASLYSYSLTYGSKIIHIFLSNVVLERVLVPSPSPNLVVNSSAPLYPLFHCSSKNLPTPLPAAAALAVQLQSAPTAITALAIVSYRCCTSCSPIQQLPQSCCPLPCCCNPVPRYSSHQSPCCPLSYC